MTDAVPVYNYTFVINDANNSPFLLASLNYATLALIGSLPSGLPIANSMRMVENPADIGRLGQYPALRSGVPYSSTEVYRYQIGGQIQPHYEAIDAIANIPGATPIYSTLKIVDSGALTIAGEFPRQGPAPEIYPRGTV